VKTLGLMKVLVVCFTIYGLDSRDFVDRRVVAVNLFILLDFFNI